LTATCFTVPEMRMLNGAMSARTYASSVYWSTRPPSQDVQQP
jgi:hypothetical protein